MVSHASRTAIIIGASSGIGEALAHQLHRAGWRLALLARRGGRLNAIQETLGADTIVRQLDVAAPDSGADLTALFDELGDVALVIISAGTGHNNRSLRSELDADTVSVNVRGFMTMAQVAMRHFLARGRGHLVGVTSVGALRSNAAGAAYCATKAFQSTYLDGLRDLADQSGHPIAVTEVQPGFVDTAMMKPEQPLTPFAKRFLVASPQKAAGQIMRAIEKRRKHAYITKRYAIAATLIRLLSRPGQNR